ncbi:hypothetical protein [Knoellia sp. Soil729]|uniref:hypothetical protein n=1 Tax=Knoellia sp. Soil729 TaxID=1736394 RepID=UPI000B309317|nr:hypothetical protein [Knoellia sp. Soil729]
MIPRNHTLSTAVRIADRIRNFRRPGSSGWTTTVDMDNTRFNHELMVASQWQQHHRSI